MNPNDTAGVAPLRRNDWRQVGPYTLLGRLGEGGMGSVYLGQRDGRRVAVKLIRPELSEDPTFRRRFRREVERARQVPPFCTAEVLDADPDHDPPYLVVEYVDGPSLASVVRDRGPLTPANVHSLAIGVATALTAIHSAGVIHHDLKPSNVLLAPGSPKVIDFGIAIAAASATTGLTMAEQVVGTVPYMAPERFEASAGNHATTAADIFAWGAVIAYAGLGRTPFPGETPHAVAYRIVTHPPNLDGLTGQLRPLVEWALAKDPAARPTARQLLDQLLGAGSGVSGGGVSADATAVLARHSDLRLAAQGAQAAQTLHVDPSVRAGLATRPAAPGPRLFKPAHPTPRRRLRRSLTTATVVVCAAALGAFAATGRLPWIGSAAHPSASGSASAPSTLTAPATPTTPGPATTTSPAGPTGSTSPTAAPATTPSLPPGALLSIEDSLTAKKYWDQRVDNVNKAACTFERGLVVTADTAAWYRCPGPRDTQAAVSVFVDVALLTPNACAGVWLRYSDNAGGYLVRICPDGYHLWTHAATNGYTTGPLHDFLFDSALPMASTTRVGVYAQDNTLRFFRDGKLIGTWQNKAFAEGRVVLGIAPEAAAAAPFEVRFSNIEIWTVTA